MYDTAGVYPASTASRLILCLVIPAKAGIQNQWHPGFRIKCGMTAYLIEADRLLGNDTFVKGRTGMMTM
jgi:hypothetical protein